MAKQSKLDIPKLAVPFQMIDGEADCVEQDSEADVVQCVEATIRTPLGFRDDYPDFGVSDNTFEQTGPLSEESLAMYQASVADGEPRSEVEMETDYRRISELISRVRINMKGRS